MRRLLALFFVAFVLVGATCASACTSASGVYDGFNNNNLYSVKHYGDVVSDDAAIEVYGASLCNGVRWG